MPPPSRKLPPVPTSERAFPLPLEEPLATADQKAQLHYTEVDCYEPKPNVRKVWESSATSTHRRSELSTTEERKQFLLEWDALQSTRQLSSINDCQINLNGVTLKGEPACLLLALQGLTAYFQAVRSLKELTSSLKDLVLSKENRTKIEEETKQIENQIKSLEEIINLEGIKRYWEGKDKSELIELFQNAVGIFWKNATTQKKSVASFLFDIHTDEIESPTFLKQISIKMLAHISFNLLPYKWSKDALFTVGNLLIRDKSLPFDIGKDLSPGPINIACKNGRKTFNQYFALLEKIDKQEGNKAADLEIDGKSYEMKEAMHFFSEHAILTYLAMIDRYHSLYEQLKLEVEQNELCIALKTATLYTSNFDKLALVREELTILKKELLDLSDLVFTPNIKKIWRKNQITYQNPTKIDLSLPIILECKVPASFNEKRFIKTELQLISEKLQAGQILHSEKLEKEQTKYWQFFYDTCDEQSLNEIFSLRTGYSLRWAINSTYAPPDPLTPKEVAWLKKAMLSAIEILRTEWVIWNKVQQFARVVSDPEFKSLIRNTEDLKLLDSISKTSQEALRNSENIFLAMSDSIQIDMHEKDYLEVNLPQTIIEHINQMNPLEQERTILNLCNLHTTTSFKKNIKNSQLLLRPASIEKWNAFIEKNKSIIDSYWQSHLAKKDRKLPIDAYYQNLIYIPFQERIGHYLILWESLKKDVPPIFRDIIELTYLHLKIKTDAVDSTSV